MSNQTKWLEALTAKIRKIDDPNPEIILPYSYKWKLTNIKDTGNIPQITFYPRGADTKIKAEIMRNANLVKDSAWAEKKEAIRQEKGLSMTDDGEDRTFARLFNKESIKYFTKLRKGVITLQNHQTKFCKTQQALSDPVQLIIADIIPGFHRETKSKPNSS
jgi:hypothetical protein